MSLYIKYYGLGWLMSKQMKFHCHIVIYTRIHKIAQYFKISHKAAVHACICFP